MPISLFKPRFLNLFHQFGPATIDQGIVSGVNFVVGLSLAKLLGLAVFGQFALIWLVMSFALEVQRAIIISPMMSLAPKNKSSEYVSSVFYLNIFLSVIAACVVGVFIHASGFLMPKWDIASFAILAGAFTLPRLLHEYFRRHFFVVGKPYTALIIDGLSSVGIVIGLGGLYMLPSALSLQDVLSVYILSYTIAVVIGFCVFKHKIFDGKSMRETILKHWQFGKWLIATVGVQYASNNYLILAAAAFLGTSVAGALRTAQYIMGVLGVLFQALENVVPAHAAKLVHEQGFKPMMAYIGRVCAGLMAVSVVFSGVVVLSADWLVGFLFDQNHEMVVPLIHGFAVFYILLVLGLCLVYALRAIEKTRPIFIAYCLTAILSLSCAKYLITTYGDIGVIYGMIGFQIVILISYIVSLYSFSKRQTP